MLECRFISSNKNTNHILFFHFARMLSDLYRIHFVRNTNQACIALIHLQKLNQHLHEVSNIAIPVLGVPLAQDLERLHFIQTPRTFVDALRHVLSLSNAFVFTNKLTLVSFASYVSQIALPRDGNGSGSRGVFLFWRDLDHLAVLSSGSSQYAGVSFPVTIFETLNTTDFLDDQPLRGFCAPLLPADISIFCVDGKTALDLVNSKSRRRALYSKLANTLHYQERLWYDVRRFRLDESKELNQQSALWPGELRSQIVSVIVQKCRFCCGEFTSLSSKGTFMVSKVDFEPSTCGIYAAGCRLRVELTRVAPSSLVTKRTFYPEIAVCLLQGTERQHRFARLKEAMRLEILPQIESFKSAEFKREGSEGMEAIKHCPVTKEVITYFTCHVDHVAPKSFARLLQKFWRYVASESCNVETDDKKWNTPLSSSPPYRLTNRDLASSWQKYHAKHAVLRVVSRSANLSMPTSTKFSKSALMPKSTKSTASMRTKSMRTPGGSTRKRKR